MESRADGVLCCQDVSIASACRAGTGTGARIEPAGTYRAKPACARDSLGCLCVIAKASIDGGHLQEGIDAARAALAMCEAMEDTWGQINAATQLVPGLLDRGAYGEAYSVGQRAVALARALEITPLLVIILTEWGNVCRAMLAPEAAKIAHSEALARCEDFMPPHYAGWIAGELCADCVVTGQWEQAHTYALKAAAARDPTIL